MQETKHEKRKKIIWQSIPKTLSQLEDKRVADFVVHKKAMIHALITLIDELDDELKEFLVTNPARKQQKIECLKIILDKVSNDYHCIISEDTTYVYASKTIDSLVKESLEAGNIAKGAFYGGSFGWLFNIVEMLGHIAGSRPERVSPGFWNRTKSHIDYFVSEDKKRFSPKPGEK